MLVNIVLTHINIYYDHCISYIVYIQLMVHWPTMHNLDVYTFPISLLGNRILITRYY